MSVACQTSGVNSAASKPPEVGLGLGLGAGLGVGLGVGLELGVGGGRASAPLHACDKGQGTTPLLHNVGGPPHTRLTWDGLAPTSSAPTSSAPTSSALSAAGRSTHLPTDGIGNTTSVSTTSVQSNQQSHTGSSLETPKFWLTVWAKRRWLTGLPRSEGSDAVVTRKIDALAQHLVAQNVLPQVALVSIEKPSCGLVHTIDNDWLLWVLKAKRASNVWMLARPVHLRHIGTRGKDFPCPDPDAELFPNGQGPIWVHLTAQSIQAIEACIKQWEGV